jgi:hypothetical protein
MSDEDVRKAERVIARHYISTLSAPEYDDPSGEIVEINLYKGYRQDLAPLAGKIEFSVEGVSDERLKWFCIGLAPEIATAVRNAYLKGKREVRRQMREALGL